MATVAACGSRRIYQSAVWAIPGGRTHRALLNVSHAAAAPPATVSARRQSPSRSSRRAHRRMLRRAHVTIASITVATSEALRRASSCRLSAGLEGRNTYRHPSRGIHSCCRIAPHKPVGLNFRQRDAREMIALLPPLPRQVLSPRILQNATSANNEQGECRSS